MKIALLGYGKMGHAVEQMALQRGHEIGCTIDNPQEWDEREEAFRQCDVAIEFSTPATVLDNIQRCFVPNIPVVVGTTGWYDHLEQMITLCNRMDSTLFVASNFSIGMNIMFALNRRLAELMQGRREYSVTIDETHHIHKLDAPSGTAITLARQIGPNVPIFSHRIGEVPGIHTVKYSSDVDTITLSHEAHSRQGLALGALLAAEFLPGHKGYYTMNDLLGL